MTGTAEDRGNGKGSARLEIPIAKIEVGGTVKNGVVDPKGLSSSDREDCLGKMRREVFQVRGGDERVMIEADLEDGRARVRVLMPNGSKVERVVPLAAKSDDGTLRVKGSVDLSLTAVGSYPVKGPMNAFRVKDRVEVIFDVAFAEPQPA